MLKSLASTVTYGCYTVRSFEKCTRNISESTRDIEIKTKPTYMTVWNSGNSKSTARGGNVCTLLRLIKF